MADSAIYTHISFSMCQVLLSASLHNHPTKVITGGNHRVSNVKVIFPQVTQPPVDATGFQPSSDNSQTSMLHRYLFSQNVGSICSFYKQEIMKVSL